MAYSKWFGSAAGLFLLYFLLGSAPALTVADVCIDPAWMAFLSQAADRHWVFGQDLIFSYGPLGHLLAGSYIGQDFHLLRLAHFGYAAALALMLALSVHSLPVHPRLLVSLAYLLLSPVDWILIGPALFGLWLLKHDKPIAYWLGLSAFCAALGLVKFNYFVYCLGLFAVFAFAAGRAGQWQRGIGMCFALAAWVLVFWRAAGGPWEQFWPWLATTFKFTLSYNQILAWPSPIGVWLFGFFWLALLLLVGALIASQAGVRQYSHTAWLAAAACAAVLSWKHGFTRGYLANYSGFFATTCLLPVFAYFPLRLHRGGSTRLSRIPVIWFEGVGRHLTPTAKTALWCLFFASIFQILFVLIGPRAVLKERFANLSQLAGYTWSPQACQAQFDQQLHDQRLRWSLGAVTQMVGSASIDLLGQDQSLLILNRLNSRPRPYFQSYCALEPEAQRRNAEFYHLATAPQYVLGFLNPMENRLPSMEDSLCWRELLAHYDYAGSALLRKYPYAWLPPADAEIPLFRRGAGVIEETPTKLADGRLEWGEPARLPPARPGSLVWLQIKIHPNTLGRLGYAICRPPELRLACYRNQAFLGEYLVLPVACASGFVIGPLLKQSRDVAQFAEKGDGLFPDTVIVTSKTPRWFQQPIRYEAFEFVRRLPINRNLVEQPKREGVTRLLLE